MLCSAWGQINQSWTTTCLSHGCAPKIIEEHIAEGSRGPEVLVVEDS